MRDFIFLWSDRNEEHIGKHNVEPDEAAYVIEHAAAPFPQKAEDAKELVWGKTESGRYLQVVFVTVLIEDVQVDEFERLEFHERIALNAGEPAVRIIHSRELTEREKGRMRRRKRSGT